MSSQTIAAVAAVVFLLIAALATAGVLMTLGPNRRSRAWPSVKGTVTHSEVTAEVTRELGDDGRDIETTLYGVKLAYAYAVDGIEHIGDRIRWSGGKTMLADGTARKVVAKYPVGRRVTVYYQPGNPAAALLEPDAAKGAVLSGVFAAAFGAFGVIFLVLAWQ